MRACRLRWLVGLAGFAAATALWLRPDPASRITRENVDRIAEGMSRAEVEAILGSPTDYTTGPVTFYQGYGYRVADGYAPRGKSGLVGTWTTDAWWAAVLFDDRGAVEFTVCKRCTMVPQGALDNLRWRAERQWRKWFP